MTLKDIVRLPASRKLDSIVARAQGHVTLVDSEMEYWMDNFAPNGRWQHVPRYSTDIIPAMTLVEEMGQKAGDPPDGPQRHRVEMIRSYWPWSVEQHGRDSEIVWTAWFVTDEFYDHRSEPMGEADTLPLAIVRLYLQWKKGRNVGAVETLRQYAVRIQNDNQVIEFTGTFLGWDSDTGKARWQVDSELIIEPDYEVDMLYDAGDIEEVSHEGES